jgi:membrane protease YdiL (CAAX protease family)
MEQFPNRLKKELTTFLVLTFGLSSIFYVFFAHAKTLNVGGGLYVGLLMWCPGVSALVTRLIFQRDVHGEGWKLAPARYELIGYALPIAYAAAAYGAVWLFDFGRVDLARFHSSPLRFATAGLVVSLAFALGEELGWRGFSCRNLRKG